ncbi:MAG: ATP synthase F1 subunit delta [Dehalococcoidia bacterium]|nr:ATP synthase F1 subunit delta [Dehalococcoidia bacterium]
MLLRDVAGKRYASAIGEIAEENNNFDYWSKLLNDASIIYHDSNSQVLFHSNEFTDEKFQSLIVDIFTEIDQQGINLMKLLKKKNRLKLIPSINSYFQEIVDQNDNVIRGEIVTAINFESSLSSIEGLLSKKLNKKVILNASADESIIGGIKLRIGDRLYDGTIKARLNKLKDSLLDVKS